MKKSTRFFVFGGLISILAGGIIMLVTGCIGGMSMLRTIAAEYTYSGWNFGRGYWYGNFHSIERYDDDYDGGHHEDWHHESATGKENILLDETEEEISSLYIYNIDGVDLEIVQSGSDGGKLLSMAGLGIEYTVDGGRLIIRSDGDKGWFPDGADIVLSVPADMCWEDVEIEFGAGELEMDGVLADRINLNVGAGEASLERIKANKMEIGVGAGEVDAEKMEISGDMDISVGFGNVEFSGAVDGSMNFSCGMGNIEFEGRNGFYEDYNYDIGCAAGNVEIEGLHFSGLSFNKQIDNNSHKDINIDCGMGNVSVYFNAARHDD